ncbi:MAG: hypothetical protein OXH00_21730 [Candidatus Poribacteria bacterium]|nr:hypothetical protein [Candidatus Poribacteria bacterium]
MLTFGKKHGIAPRGAAVAKFIIKRVLKIDSMPEIQSVLSIEGVTPSTSLNNASTMD